MLLAGRAIICMLEEEHMELCLAKLWAKETSKPTQFTVLVCVFNFVKLDGQVMPSPDWPKLHQDIKVNCMAYNRAQKRLPAKTDLLMSIITVKFYR